jgi:hypothetical protein
MQSVEQLPNSRPLHASAVYTLLLVLALQRAVNLVKLQQSALEDINQLQVVALTSSLGCPRRDMSCGRHVYHM